MSTLGKATPGPWRVANVGAVVCDTHDETTHHKPFELEDYGGALIAESIKHPPNARLIAAAPALLEACKHAVELLDWCGPQRGFTGTEHQAMYDDVRAAIAQAEGQA